MATPENIMQAWSTKYGLTTQERQQRNAPILWRRTGRKREALDHAQMAANALQTPVYVVERDEGIPDYITIIQPQ
jgi:hypothetical protein